MACFLNILKSSPSASSVSSLFLSVSIPSSLEGTRARRSLSHRPGLLHLTVTHLLAPALLPKAPQEAEPAPAFLFEGRGPVREPRGHFYFSQGLTHVQTLRGRNQSLPQFGGVPAWCQARLFSCFTSTFLLTSAS